ncbi:lytic murein transglycosylase B [Thiorhodococcus mannitoliphagus]|uniref:Lytic murein transglycosylase B n=1 Tax=Thiorhodococcus mannitoliphagus TaxID=329406 RepID=A0A6P1E0X1_9GAMM|nr:lytic murein transglycosylase B [Thiorhodococcus mannitoliphagus]NEX22122.1 lytic murein transglycosylase B [Thiorhodococcus mannitoliphagus]
MRILSTLFALGCLGILAGCGSTSTRDAPNSAYRAIPASATANVSGDFAGSPGVSAFIQRMERQGFPPNRTAAIISGAQRKQSIIDLMDRQAPSRKTGPNGAWTRYRAKFLTDQSIDNGVSFWRRNEAALSRAASRYGVPPEYIVAIIGVETRYGGFVGKTRIIDALSTLSFAYPRRADYFSGELENFLIMTRDEGLDPFAPQGSFAGAMGLCQFMPSSFHDYAVDHTGDGHRDLWNPGDAIGSVANYFARHGWQPGEPVAVRARVSSPGTAEAMKAGFKSSYSLGELSSRGISPVGSVGRTGQVSLIRLDARGGYEYWIGLKNFYVITRYNHSNYYAMAVYQLAQAIRARKGGPSGTRISSTR